MAELQTYYYFYQGRVVSSHSLINNLVFERLTEGMVVFFLQNPTASVLEIKNRQLTVAPVIDVEEYRTKKINDLHNLSLSTSNAVVAGWQITDAFLGVYDSAKNEATLTKAADIATRCIAEYTRVEALILAAGTIEDIDAAFNSNTYSEMK